MPQSILTSQTPATADSNSPAGQRVLALVFSADVAGYVVGVRWFSPTVAATSAPVGMVWQPTAANPNATTATLLASKTFGAITDGAWNSVLFDTPVLIAPNTPYAVGVWTPDHYTFSNPDPWPITNGRLTAYSNATSGNGRFENGVISGSYPTTGSAGYNFFVDVLFEQAAPPGPVRRLVIAPRFQRSRRARSALVVPVVAYSPPVWLPGPVRRTARPMLVRRRQMPQVPPAQAWVPPAPRRPHLPPLPRSRRSPARFFAPAPLPPNPVFVSAAVRRRPPAVFRRRGRSSGGWWPTGVCDCVTHRPSAGVTARPSSGTTTRPNTGITGRPCSC
jgi:hypothetical protein